MPLPVSRTDNCTCSPAVTPRFSSESVWWPRVCVSSMLTVPRWLPRAWIALVHRLSSACSIWVASASTAGVFSSIRTTISTVGGSVTLSKRTVSCTTSANCNATRAGDSLRLNARIWRTRSRARRPALSISAKLIRAGESWPASCCARATLPKMAPMMLLKSCAMPPAMVPTACILCDSRSCDSSVLRCASIFLRALRSRAKTVVVSPSGGCSNDMLTSMATSLPSDVSPVISPSWAWLVRRLDDRKSAAAGRKRPSALPSAWADGQANSFSAVGLKIVIR